MTYIVKSQKNFFNSIFTGCHNLPLKWYEENRAKSEKSLILNILTMLYNILKCMKTMFLRIYTLSNIYNL